MTHTEQIERMQILNEIASLLGHFGFNERGICTDFGRFKGESLATVYFAVSCPSEEGLTFGTGEVLIDLFRTTEVERAILGAPAAHWLYMLEYHSEGTLSGRWTTEEHRTKLRTQNEEMKYFDWEGEEVP